MREQIPANEEVELDVGTFLRNLLKKLPYVVVFVGLVSTGTFYGLGSLTPKYRTDTTILIEVGETSLTSPTQGSVESRSEAVLGQEAIASQVQLVLSREIASKVVQRLDLASNAEFNPDPQVSIIDRVMALAGIASERPEKTDRQRAESVIDAYYDRVSAYAIEGSRVIAIEFESEDPELAANAANSIAREYLNLQSQAKQDTTANAAEWLSSQIDELSDTVQRAEARVEEFRSANDLFSSGAGGAGRPPVTLTQQQLSDLSSELSRVRAQRTDAEARARQVSAGLEAGVTPNQPAIQNSPLIQSLVEQQVGLRAQIAQLSATLLPQHPRMQELQAQVDNLDRQIAGEARKILSAAELEVDIARAREDEINAELGRLKAATTRANNAEVELRALEREAVAQRDLLDSYLRRYREALAREQTGILPADARVISAAAIPLDPFFPRKVPLTAMIAVATLLLLSGILLLTELASGRSMRAVPSAGGRRQEEGETASRGRRWDDAPGVRRIMPETPSIVPELEDHTERSLASIVQQIGQGGHRRILVTLSEESDQNGRPLAAVALARALARADRRTVLVDLKGDGADSISMGEAADLPGVIDLARSEASFAQSIFRDRSSRAHFVPLGRGSVEDVPADRLETLLSALTMTYDNVVLDADDGMLAMLAEQFDLAVVVSEFAAEDPRTVSAFAKISEVSDKDIVLLTVDPAPDEAEASTTEADEPEAVA